MKRLVAVASLLTLAAACTSTPERSSVTITEIQPSFEVAANEQGPMTIVTASCGGEPVVFTGTMHIVQRVTADGSGGNHSGFLLQAHLDGVGASGNQYLLNLNESFQKNTDGASTQTFVSRTRVISKGALPNFYAKITIHTTTNANGEITADHADISAECSP